MLDKRDLIKISNLIVSKKRNQLIRSGYVPAAVAGAAVGTGYGYSSGSKKHRKTNAAAGAVGGASAGLLASHILRKG